MFTVCAMTPDERTVRNDLIVRLYMAGCTMHDIKTYLAVSHGLVAAAVKKSPLTSSRPRGRPCLDDPAPKTPREILGDDYIPDYMSESDKTLFILRLPGQPLQHMKRQPPPSMKKDTRLDFDLPVPVESVVGLDLSDGEETDDAASTIRNRIAEVASRIDTADAV